MSHHVEQVSKLNAILSEFDISSGKNVEKLTEGKNESELFKSQQTIMEAAIHACDISQPTRSFDITKEWTYLLFEEFFMQGDLELSKELPISMLCDRNTTNVAGSQPGFINFVSIPMFYPLSNILPVLSECVDQAKANAISWKSYKETDEDIKVYSKPQQNLESVIENEFDSSFESERSGKGQKKILFDDDI